MKTRLTLLLTPLVYEIQRQKKLLMISLLLLMSVQTALGSSIRRAEEPIHDEYIVVLQDQLDRPVAEVAAMLARAHGGKVVTLYENTIKGFYVRMTEAQALAVSRNPQVQWVEENAVVTLAASQTIGPPPTSSTTVPGSLWGLDRSDQPAPAANRVDHIFNYCSNGSTVRAYVVDTGILPTHAEFEGRVDTAPSLTTLLNNSSMGLGQQCWYFSNFRPDASHGTAVASVLGGKTLGIAKKVTLVDARAFNCIAQGSTARITKVLDWIPTDPNRGSAPMVVNLSFRKSTTDDPDGSINATISRLVDSYGIIVVAAAGNQNAPVSSVIPANALRAIVVGGLNKDNDSRWQYSNYGDNVSIYAPAQFVEAASTLTKQFRPSMPRDQYRSELTSGNADVACDNPGYLDTCTSGTSFASPFTAGAIARYLQRNPSATRDQALSYLQSQSAALGGVRVTEPLGRTVPILNVSDCTSIFTSQTPTTYLAASPGYEVATQFSSSVAGYITALRFFKAPGETGDHTVRLWTDNGMHLGSVTFTSSSETAWGWQEKALAAPIFISAGTRYRVSHNTNTQQSKTPCGISSPITNGVLTAYAGYWGSPNGVFPTTSSCSNFFGDIRLDR